MKAHLWPPMCCLVLGSCKGYDPYSTASTYLQCPELFKRYYQYAIVLVLYVKETLVQTDRVKKVCQHLGISLGLRIFIPSLLVT